MVTLRSLLANRLRLTLTVFGVALCVVLMLFLQAVYEGVREGSVEYVRQSPADVWVLQRGQTNVLRGTSMLPAAQAEAIRAVPGVASTAPVLFLMAGVEVEGGRATLYLTGFDPADGRGGPPDLAAGQGPVTDDEIVLDASFAAKHGFEVGDEVRLGDGALTVSGLSRGTNMFVIQYAFTTLARAQRTAGLPGTVSAWLVNLDDGAEAGAVVAALRAQLKVEAYDHATFVANNVREMESGFLPLLYTIAVIGAVVLTAILSLILSVDVVERRGEFAVMKALGAPGGTVPALVMRQALVLTGLGLALGMLLFLPLVTGIERVAPEVSARVALLPVLGTCLGVLAIGLVSSLIPIHRLRRVYALEVFR